MDEPARTELLDLLADRDAGMDLDRAALSLATIEFPGLDINASVRIVDVLAREADLHTRPASNGREFVAGLNDFLFQHFGLRGNSEDYYDPNNSCLNEVLTRRLGIPITLSLLYLEIARRLERPVFGIGLPGHFLVRYDDGLYSTFIDPFHGGMLRSADQCYALAGMSTGDPRVLEPVGKRQILFRMINNLRGIYFLRRNFGKALQVMDLLIDATPDLADNYKQRALLRAHVKQMRAAREDMHKYLELAPNAEDRGEIEQQLLAVARWLAALN